MNRDMMQGKWKQIKGTIQSKWGKLTNDDVELVQGKFETLAGTIQLRYGLAKDKAEQELDAYIAGIDDTKLDP